MFESTAGIRLEAKDLHGADGTSAAIPALLGAPRHAATSARSWKAGVVEDFVARGGRGLAAFKDDRTSEVRPIGAAFYRDGEIEPLVVSAIAGEGSVEQILIPAAFRQVARRCEPRACLRLDAGEDSA